MEITVVLAIVSAVMLVVYSLIDQTVRATMFNESHNDLSVLSQQAVNALQSEIVQTRVSFEENAAGSAYRSAMTLPAGTAVWADSLLPIADPSGTLDPDPDKTRYTGNSLLLARQLEPLAITYDHDGKAGTAEVEFLADRYRFEYIYLARDKSRSFANSGMTLDLKMSVSGEYADYFQLSNMGAAIGKLAKKLTDAKLTHAWNPGQPLDNAFYQLSGATDGTFDAPLKTPAIATVRTRSLLRGLLGGRISGKMDYSVAFASYPIPTPMRVFAQPVSGKPGFPSGFEVKVAGPAQDRQVLTRVVVMSRYATDRYESQQSFVVTAARF